MILRFSRDSWGRLYTVVVAIDAKPGLSYEVQLSPPKVKRELEKVASHISNSSISKKNYGQVNMYHWGPFPMLFSLIV